MPLLDWMPDEVIKRVNLLGQDQPKHITFTDQYGDAIVDYNADIPGVPGYIPTDDNGDNNANIPGVPVDNVKLPGVDVDEANEDQALPDITPIKHPMTFPNQNST